jgi:hypothetical protein
VEERLEVIVEPRESQLSALLVDALREGDEDAKPRAVDVARPLEVDHELARAGIELREHRLLELLPVARDELALHGHVAHFPVPLQ